MNRKLSGLLSFLMIFVVLSSSVAYAGDVLTPGFDVSIDRVRVNGKVIAESRTNLIPDASSFSVVVDFTTLRTLQRAHVEAILRGRQSGNTVADSSGTFDISGRQSSSVTLSLALIDKLKNEDNYDLVIKITDAKGSSEQKTFGIKTRERAAASGASGLDVSIDNVKLNGKVIAQSSTNFIGESRNFDVLASFTANEDLQNAHVEATLNDLTNGLATADASPNFNLGQDSSTSKLLRLALPDKFKTGDSFELIVKIIDADGNSAQRTYGIVMKANSEASQKSLDISVDSVELENKIIAENENNFVAFANKKDLNLNIKLTSLESIRNAHIDAVLTFENGNSIADATSTFDITNNQQLAKSLKLSLIDKFKQGDFRLKIKVTDADGNSLDKEYTLKISQQKIPFVESSISLTPDNIQAGKSLGVTLGIQDIGIAPLEDVVAQVSITELGITSTKFLGKIDNANGMHAAQDFILKIPDNVQTGTYTLRTEITSQYNGNSEVKEIPVSVTGKNEQANPSTERLVINAPIINQNIKNDGSEVIYPLTLTNEGTQANAYTISLDGSGWANLRLSDSNVVVIQPKESKTLNVYASTKSSEGSQIFLVTIKSNEKELKQIPFRGNVISASGFLSPSAKSFLKGFLIVIVILLAVVGLYFGVKSYMQKDEEATSEFVGEEIPSHANGEAYY